MDLPRARPQSPIALRAIRTFHHVDLDRDQVISLAHPARSRLLTALRPGGPATSTMLAERLGTNTDTTSYPLRRLASVGIVEDARDPIRREDS